MDKEKIITSLIEQLRDQYQRTLAAVKDAAEGATGDDTKAESKYDTRGLESSYLAAGQIEQAERQARELADVEGFEFPGFDNQSKIDLGALVEADLNGKQVYYLIAPAGGGISIENDSNMMIMTIGPAAPLAGQLFDKTTGDTVDHPPLKITGVY